jgi:hypothetical protein
MRKLHSCFEYISLQYLETCNGSIYYEPNVFMLQKVR